jgi:hypothetical protein
MSPLLGNHEYDLTLSWQNFTVKVEKRSAVNDSTGAWLRSLIRCKDSEEITILNSGELKEKSLLVNFRLLVILALAIELVAWQPIIKLTAQMYLYFLFCSV